LALGPFEIERGDRNLVADPSAIIMEDATTIFSSDQSVEFKSTLGVELLTNSFETNVWYSILITLILITIFSSIWETKSNKPLHMNKKSFSKILIRNSFEYAGNLLNKCKLSF
jgi:hypothetical protein